jgi:hypothetical protein
MAFNINEIKSQLTFGGAKASLFQVAISNPINGAGDLKTPFMVQAAKIPEATLGTIEVPYFGRKVKIAGDRTFAEWSVTIINDEDFLIRNAMEQWMASINSNEGNVTQLGGASSDYKAQAQITQYGKTGDTLRTYNFNGLFPTNISEITMDWNTTDAIETFEVTFQYDWWNVSGGITGDGGTNE